MAGGGEAYAKQEKRDNGTTAPVSAYTFAISALSGFDLAVMFLS